MSLGGTWVPVGLFGLQTTTSWVAAVMLGHRRQVVAVGVVEVDRDRARAESAARCGYIEKDGHA